MSASIRSAAIARSILAAAVVAALLAGCGGGGGGGGATGATPAPTPAPAPAPAPVATLLNPTSLEAYSALDTRIRAQFSVDVDASTVNQNTVFLAQGTLRVPATITLTGREVEIKPLAGLEMTRPYTIVLATGIKSTAGVALAQEARFNFLTVPPAAQVTTIDMPVSKDAVSVAVGDVNGDGRADIVTTRSGANVTDTLQVVLQRADGTLAAPTGYKMSSVHCVPTSVAVGDVNHDGKNDIVVGTLADSAGEVCGIQVFAQSATGTIGAAQLLPTLDALRVKLVDLDRDGFVDLIGAGFNTGSISVFRQIQAGVFDLETSYAVDTGTDDFAVGDINNDGRPDIVQMRGLNRGSPQFGVLAQKADGTFAAAKYYDLPPPFATTGVTGNLTVGDINGDGLADVAVTVTGSAPFARVITFYQNAQGELAAGAPLASYELPAAIRTADIDHDGKTDLVVVNRDTQTVTVYYAQPRQEGLVGWLYKVPSTANYPDALAIGDINGDGSQDIVMATANGLVLIRIKPSTPATPAA